MVIHRLFTTSLSLARIMANPFNCPSDFPISPEQRSPFVYLNNYQLSSLPGLTFTLVVSSLTLVSQHRECVVETTTKQKSNTRLFYNAVCYNIIICYMSLITHCLSSYIPCLVMLQYMQQHLTRNLHPKTIFWYLFHQSIVDIVPKCFAHQHSSFQDM